MARSRSISAGRRSSCPISCALDLIGDRWTLLVIRDLFRGKSRYSEFVAGPEGIPTNVLADRLKRLESAELISSSRYQDNPPRSEYALTAKGRDLKPVLAALGTWSLRHVPGAATDPALRAQLLR
jgi:DNA-binding HxlR family transcriptional regulator